MIADGLLERFPMERVFAFHNWPGIEAGTVAVHDGPVMAAGGRWQRHPAWPRRPRRDPAPDARSDRRGRPSYRGASHHRLAQCRSCRCGRTLDRQVHGGVVSNQIPGSVTLVGTLRTYDQEVRTAVIKRMESIIAGICEAYGMRADVEILSTGRPIINSPDEAELAVAAARDAGVPVRRDVRPSTTGDDFSFLRKHRPGAYVWIGNGPAGPDGELHNSRYDFNDAILPVAIAWMSKVARLPWRTRHHRERPPFIR
jgi:metal-dependent amidase/aminoacylase/carboxypeptidase family protein